MSGNGHNGGISATRRHMPHFRLVSRLVSRLCFVGSDLPTRYCLCIVHCGLWFVCSDPRESR